MCKRLRPPPPPPPPFQIKGRFKMFCSSFEMILSLYFLHLWTNSYGVTIKWTPSGKIFKAKYYLNLKNEQKTKLLVWLPFNGFNR